MPNNSNSKQAANPLVIFLDFCVESYCGPLAKKQGEIAYLNSLVFKFLYLKELPD